VRQILQALQALQASRRVDAVDVPSSGFSNRRAGYYSIDLHMSAVSALGRTTCAIEQT